jgi:hypothetical protein
MKNLKNPCKLTCWLLISLLIIPIAKSTAQVKEMSVKDLTKESTAVLYGRCSKVKCEWNENKSIMYSYITVVTEGYIKGSLGAEAIIAVPGGRIEDTVYEVSEMPVFTEGEDVVAFVWTNPAGKNLVTGGYQGKMKIEKDSKTGKRMVQAVGLDAEADFQKQGRGKTLKSEKVPLEDFVTKVRGYANN